MGAAGYRAAIEEGLVEVAVPAWHPQFSNLTNMLSNPSQSTVADGEKEEEDGELREDGADGEHHADGDRDEKEEESGEVGQDKEVGGDGDEDPSKFHNWRGRGAAQMILPLVASHPKFQNFYKRIGSFKQWPADLTMKPEELAEAGLYHSPSDDNADRVCCFHCGGGLMRWKVSHLSAWVVHAKHYPDCSFLMEKKDKQFITDSSLLPTNPQFEKESARLASFTSWPSELKMRPEELAKAGFFHFPVDKHPDQVTCFHCNGNVFGWKDKGGSAWAAHEERSPYCFYLKERNLAT